MNTIRRYRWRGQRWLGTMLCVFLIVVFLTNAAGNAFWAWTFGPGSVIGAFLLATAFVVDLLTALWLAPLQNATTPTLRERAEAEKHGTITRDEAIKIAFAAVRAEIDARLNAQQAYLDRQDEDSQP